jgi:serine/threonine-protein phosphatase 4 regulatory subunit 1
VALSKDRYGIVRVSVIETLGEVLHTFQNDPGGPPRELLELFLGRQQDRNVREGSHWSCYSDLEPQPTDQTLEYFFTDPERPLICAFNFPAVVVTLGRQRWPELRESYLDLARHKNVHLRKTMAASLGEIALVIGPGAAVQDLVPVWWESVRFDDESVRTKGVEALGKLVVAIPKEAAKELVDGLVTLWEEGRFRGWREREMVVTMLDFFLETVGSASVGATVRRLILKGLEDNVAAVREAVRSVVWPPSFRVICDSLCCAPRCQRSGTGSHLTLYLLLAFGKISSPSRTHPCSGGG